MGNAKRQQLVSGGITATEKYHRVCSQVLAVIPSSHATSVETTNDKLMQQNQILLVVTYNWIGPCVAELPDDSSNT
jgi:hypothetical protein